MSILQTIDLKKYYGAKPNITRALDGVNFSVEDGEFVAVVGTSGSGKSTLLNMMGGLDTPTSGNVIVRDKELSKMNDEQLTIFRRRNIGFIESSRFLQTPMVMCRTRILLHGICASYIKSVGYRKIITCTLCGISTQPICCRRVPANRWRHRCSVMQIRRSWSAPTAIRRTWRNSRPQT